MAETSSSSPLTIDCSVCVMRRTDACSDCVVTYICERPPESAVVIPMSEYLALRSMSEVGLVPRLRHRLASEAV